MSPPLPDFAAAPVAAARPSPGTNAEVAAMLAGAGLVLATTCSSAGGAAAAEVRPATRTVTGEPYSAANLVITAAVLFFRWLCRGSALLATRAVHLVYSFCYFS